MIETFPLGSILAAARKQNKYVYAVLAATKENTFRTCS